MLMFSVQDLIVKENKTVIILNIRLALSQEI
jgi:hypothetical protein